MSLFAKLNAKPYILFGLVGVVFLVAAGYAYYLTLIPSSYTSTQGRIIARVNSSNVDTPPELNVGKYPLISYTVDGKTYKQRYDFASTFAVNNDVTVWYNASSPADKIVVEQFTKQQKIFAYVLAAFGTLSIALSILVKRNKLKVESR
jgi:hypothetical protein